MTTAGPAFGGAHNEARNDAHDHARNDAHDDPQRTNPDLPRVTPEPRMRPRDRRIVQALALTALVPAFLVLKWTDETHSVQKNLKPPEKVTTVPNGATGTLAGAQWKVAGRQVRAPLAFGSRPKDDTVTELQVVLAVRPDDAAAAKTVGAYGFVYTFTDGGGRSWSATGLTAGTPQQGAVTRLTVRGTVPRSEAATLALRVQAPKTSRKPGAPLPSLRFAP
ncbi:hypothetical protein [Actinomadura opuntiae]|uniref:hypothetical protein n=1 Tax=Actinomadura sp. OS1-43 TaxID=604315 RepID=UPI00255AFE0A|nr:hypothetical protein [Actinomadura sp. OS1-43]MDL4814915.1 hypothetical protein [Actinomadura sp. OS1-43]